MSFDLNAANENTEKLCGLVEHMNAPDPTNPGNLSAISYRRVMEGLHDTTWVRDFVPDYAECAERMGVREVA